MAKNKQEELRQTDAPKIKGSRLGSKPKYSQTTSIQAQLPLVKLHIPIFSNGNFAKKTPENVEYESIKRPRPPTAGSNTTGLTGLKSTHRQLRPKSSSNASRESVKQFPERANEISKDILLEIKNLNQAAQPDEPIYHFEEYFKAKWFYEKPEFQIEPGVIITAKSMFYSDKNNENGTWEPCHVLDYNPRSGYFKIQFFDPPLEKNVHRINLLLPSDNETEFLKKREIHFQELRLIFELVQCQRYIESENASDISHLATNTKARITQAAICTIGTVKGILKAHSTKLTNMLGEIDEDYSNVMKRCKIIHSENVHTPLGSSLVQSYLEYRSTKHFASELCMSNHQSRFKKAQNRMQSRHLDANSMFLQLHQRIMKISSKILSSVTVFYEMNSDYDAPKYRMHPPFCLKDYIGLQKECINDALDTLKFEWHQEIIHLLESTKISSGMNFDKFSKRLDFSLSNLFHNKLVNTFSNLHRSIFSEYCVFVKQEDSRPVSALRRRIWSSKIHQRRRPPVLLVKLIVVPSNSGHRVVQMQPSQTEIEHHLSKLVTTTIRKCIEFSCFEGDNIFLSRGKNDSTKPSLIEKSYDLKPLEELAVDNLRRHLRIAFDKPNERVGYFQSLFDEFETRITLLRQIWSKIDTFLSADDFSTIIHQMQWFVNAYDECLKTPNDADVFSFLILTTSQVKETFLYEIRKVIQEVCDGLSRNCNLEEEKILQEYLFDLKTLETSPNDEATLDHMWKFLNEIEKNINQRAILVKLIDRRFDEIDTIGFSMNKNIDLLVLNQHWSLWKYPIAISQHIKGCKETCSLKMKSLSASLYSEKCTFEIELEDLKDAINDLSTKCEWSRSSVDAFADEAQSLHEHVESSRIKLDDFARRDKIFGWKPMDVSNVTQLVKLLDPYYIFWTMASDFISSTGLWTKTPFDLLCAKEVIEKVTIWQSQLQHLEKILGKYSKLIQPLASLKEELNEFCQSIPIIEMVATGAMRERHWNLILNMLQLNSNTFIIEHKLLFTLEDLIEFGILSKKKELNEIYLKAMNEYEIEQRLTAMKYEWIRLNIQVIKYSKKDFYLIENFKQLRTVVDDQLISIYRMEESPYGHFLSIEMNEWEMKLNLALELLLIWKIVQVKWQYVEMFFNNQDNNATSQDFMKMELIWCKIMDLVRGSSGFSKVVDSENFKEPLEKCLKLLRASRKSIQTQVESKRFLFPKLHFVSNFDIAMMIKATKVDELPPLLNGAFEGIENFHVLNSSITKIEMKSMDILQLSSPVPSLMQENGNCLHDVIETLCILDTRMKDSMKNLIWSTCLGTSFDVIYKLDLPLQVILVILQIHWTEAIENLLNFQFPIDTLVSELEYLELDMIRTIRSNGFNMKKTLIISELIQLKKKTIALKETTIDSFTWKCTAKRYLSNRDDTIRNTSHVVQMMKTTCNYGDEFLQVRYHSENETSEQVVFTAFYAFRHFKGLMLHDTLSVPTMLYLSQYLGVAFNMITCSKDSTWKDFGNLLRGAALGGSWCYFNNVNTAQTPVLSLFTQAIMQISTARMDPNMQVNLPLFPKFEIRNSFSIVCSMSSTMNISSSNLESLFISQSVIMPSTLPLAKSLLYVHGFEYVSIS